MKQTTAVHTDVDWMNWLAADIPASGKELQDQELQERIDDVEELRWLLDGLKHKLDLFARTYPDRPFERELSGVFHTHLEQLEDRQRACAADPLGCDLDSFLATKYQIRMLYKQLGAVIEGSDWQSPCKRLGTTTEETSELGFAQTEENTYERSYGSEAVKAYEALALRNWYGLDASTAASSLGFLTKSGMKALELALFACKQDRAGRPFYIQEGFYGEGTDLAKLVLDDAQELTPQAIYDVLESGEPVGGLLLDPGMSWPARPAINLEELMKRIIQYRRPEPLYLIVDRTLTGIANPLLTRYASKLPRQVIVVSIESTIKYLQYGMDLTNAGFLASTGARLADEQERQRWIDLLALLDAGASPLTARQLPEPELNRLTARLARVNRNAALLSGFLDHQLRQGKIEHYQGSVSPSETYLLAGEAWRGSIAYVRLPECRTEEQVQRRIDNFVAAAPGRSHFVSGGSFGFDTFRMNAVSAKDGTEAALRMSVGRDPILQLLTKLRYVDRELFRQS